MRHRIARPLLFLLAVTAGASAVPSRLAAHGAGMTELALVDPERASRPVPTVLWYPAAGDGCGAPMADSPADGFPLVVFGHSFLAEPAAYAWLGDQLARDGWLVAMPATELTMLAGQGVLAADMRFVREMVIAMGADPASLLHGRVSPRVAFGGHSLGGGAATLAAAAEGVGDGPGTIALFSFALLKGDNPSVGRYACMVGAPALMLAGELDCVTEPALHQEPVYETLASPYKALVTVLGAGHCGYNGDDPECLVAESLCSPPPQAAAPHLQALALELLRPWLAWQLRADAAAEREYRQRLAQLAGEALVAEAWTPASVRAPAPPEALVLTDIRPNPFNPRVSIRFSLAAGEVVRLAIHDAGGRLVRTLLAGHLGPGEHEIAWDGRDDRGAPAPAGIYFARASTRETVRVRKLVMIR